jgi:hypothetical protein
VGHTQELRVTEILRTRSRVLDALVVDKVEHILLRETQQQATEHNSDPLSIPKSRPNNHFQNPFYIDRVETMQFSKYARLCPLYFFFGVPT